jgi:hypothetical protein
MPVTSEEALRLVELVPWPKKENSQMAPEHREDNDESGSDDCEKGDECTNNRYGESENDEEVNVKCRI